MMPHIRGLLGRYESGWPRWLNVPEVGAVTTGTRTRRGGYVARGVGVGVGDGAGAAGAAGGWPGVGDGAEHENAWLMFTTTETCWGSTLTLLNPLLTLLSMRWLLDMPVMLMGSMFTAVIRLTESAGPLTVTWLGSRSTDEIW